MKLAQYRSEIDRVESGEVIGSAEGFEATLGILRSQLRRALWSNQAAREEAAELASRCDMLLEKIAPVASRRNNTAKQREAKPFSEFLQNERD